MKTRYEIVRERGFYYIEKTSSFMFFVHKQRLTFHTLEPSHHNEGTEMIEFKYIYKFDTYECAEKFLKHHRLK